MIDRLTSEEFHPEHYEDEYRIRVLAVLDEKSKGKEIVTGAAPAPKRGQVIDIMEALKRSMERMPAKQPATAPAAKKKKDSRKSSNCRHRVPRFGRYRYVKPAL